MKTYEHQSCGSRLLQPLREIGLSEKTQSWDMEEIQAALREAYARGIQVESLFGTGNRVITPTAGPSPALPST